MKPATEAGRSLRHADLRSAACCARSRPCPFQPRCPSVRPAASLFGAAAIPLCLCVRMGRITPTRPLHPIDRHTDEIRFGYVNAVLAGFLFTAAPNRTGRMPAQGLLLAAAVVSGLGRPVS
ncbi:MAG: NnrS family protein [Paracoccaceae bacterium]|nr:NnrS family protein [Paracoccaceae bacterium]